MIRAGISRGVQRRQRSVRRAVPVGRCRTCAVRAGRAPFEHPSCLGFQHESALVSARCVSNCAVIALSLCLTRARIKTCSSLISRSSHFALTRPVRRDQLQSCRRWVAARCLQRIWLVKAVHCAAAAAFEAYSPPSLSCLGHRLLPLSYAQHDQWQHRGAVRELRTGRPCSSCRPPDGVSIGGVPRGPYLGARRPPPGFRHGPIVLDSPDGGRSRLRTVAFIRSICRCGKSVSSPSSRNLDSVPDSCAWRSFRHRRPTASP